MREDKEDPDAKVRNGKDKGIIGCYKQKTEKKQPNRSFPTRLYKFSLRNRMI